MRGKKKAVTTAVTTVTRRVAVTLCRVNLITNVDEAKIELEMADRMV